MKSKNKELIKIIWRKKMEENLTPIEDCYATLYVNGLYGFQYGIGIKKSKMAICFVSSDLTEQQVAEIRRSSGCNSIQHDDFIGHGYLTISFADRDKIVDVFNALLNIGHWFTTQNHARVHFDPVENRNLVAQGFSFQLMEKMMIVEMRKTLREFPRFIDFDSIFTWRHFNPWNYITDDGRIFCNEIRLLKHMTPIGNIDNQNDQDNYWNWPLFRNPSVANESFYNLRPVETQNNGNDNQNMNVDDNAHNGDNDDNDFLCMICFERVPDTIVKPCNHVVVCSICSDSLKNTADRTRCVRCRQILESEPEKI
jgi:hypothetical protein